MNLKYYQKKQSVSHLRSYSALKKNSGGGDEEGWLISFSDLMTLLLCFFVILMSISKIDVSKMDAVATSLSNAMHASSKHTRSKLMNIKDDVESILELEGIDEICEVEQVFEGIKVNCRAVAFFKSGKAQMLPKAKKVLEKVVRRIKDEPFKIDVEGHTDNIPIKNKLFPSNWELSSARASEVVNFFISIGIKPTRLRAIGMADTIPIAPNTTTKNRAKNRRVVLIFVPERL